MNNRQPFTILYERLSRDDELQGPSNSILNQQRLLEEYADRNGLAPYEHISDDGYSGTNFNRPGWQKLIAEVEAGNVSTVIFKDMSRMGRDYLRVGLYMEMFREKGVRLIAVNDAVDTALGEDDFTPFRNIMAEWYARDTSRKIKSVLNAKGRDGKPLTNSPPFGFLKDPNDKYHWVVDETAAQIVRRIYKMTVDGMGPWLIAQTLCNEQIERPSYYLGKQGLGNKRNTYDTENPYAWRSATVVEILSRPEYCGHTVNFRTSKESYKDKRSKENEPENWMIFENTHEAIIDSETWETVQRLRQTVRRHDTLGEANPLTGILFCGDCGAKMYNKRYRGGGKRLPRDDYECSTYKLSKDHFGHNCSSHSIRSVVVREIILSVIKRVSIYARENEAEFIEKIREASTVQQTETAKSHRRQITKNERRIAELDKLFRRTYEDNVNGKLSDERFEQLSGGYEHEQLDLKAQNAVLSEELESFERDSARADKFIDLTRRYINIDTLTNAMINEFVQKIIVYSRVSNEYGDRIQQVDVYLNFIGKFEIPDETPEPTPEELAEQERQGQKRLKQREYYHQWYMKRKKEKQNQTA